MQGNIEFKEIEYNDLNKIVALWNRNIGVIYPMDMLLFKQNLDMDKNWRKIIGAYSGNILTGFIILKQWTQMSGFISPKPASGYINSLIVDMNYRKQGIAAKLLDLAEKELQLRGVKHISMGSDPFHFFPGVPMEFSGFQSYLSKRNYKTSNIYYDVISNISSCEFKDLPGIKINNENSVGILGDTDKEELYIFFERCFSGRWYEEIKTFFNFGMENRDIVVVKDGNRIIGFCHIYDDKSKVLGPSVYWRKLLGEQFGGLGPIGIDPDYRGKGLGLTILYKSLEILKSRNVKNMAIDWTDLVDFYGMFNFIQWKQYTRTVKEI